MAHIPQRTIATIFAALLALVALEIHAQGTLDLGRSVAVMERYRAQEDHRGLCGEGHEERLARLRSKR